MAGFGGGRGGGVARVGLGGRSEKKNVLDHMFMRIWSACQWAHGWRCARLCIVLATKLMTRRLLEHAWVFWAPQWAAVCAGHLDESFQERKYGESVRIASRGRLPLARSALIAPLYFFNPRAKKKCSSRLCGPTVDYCNHIWLRH